MDAKLVVVGGNAKAKEITLRLPAVVGRGRDATVMLPHPLVSRQHCEIFEANGYLMVRDIGSLNGTFINNERVTEAVLPPGGLLTLGSVTFQAVYEVGGTPAAPPIATPANSRVPKAPVEKVPPKRSTKAKAVQDFDDFQIEANGEPRAARTAKDESAKKKAVRKEKPPKREKPPKGPPATEPPPEDDLADFLKDFQ